MPRLIPLLLVGILALLIGCASVPKEVVELSYVMGEDLVEVHRSYVALIELHFDDLRTRTSDFLDNKWQPVYLRNFIQLGDLVGLATHASPDTVLLQVHAWSLVALDQIAAKRHELLDPLDDQEQELLDAVNEAFDRLITANSVITAHLISLREVKEVQDDALKALGLKDLRDQISKGLVKASVLAEEGIRKTIDAEGLIDDAQAFKDEVKERAGVN